MASPPAPVMAVAAALLLTPCAVWAQTPSYWNTGLECTEAKRALPPLAAVGTTMPQAIELRSPKMPHGLPKGQEQTATLSFVIDADGRVEPCTIQIVQETDRRWTAASVEALVAARFKPAATGGTPVRLSTRQRFVGHP